jgi:hypothetical protein
LLRVQTPVPRADGESIVFSYGWNRHNSHSDIQIFDEPLDYSQLLSVFFSEIRPIRLNDMKQFQNYCRYSAKMSRSELPAELIANPLDLDERTQGTRIHLLDRWHKNGIDAQLLAVLDVSIGRARILIKVFLLVELNRIYENADDHEVRFTNSAFNQAGVTAMKRPHGRYKTDNLSGSPYAAQPPPQRLDGMENFRRHSILP